MKNPDFKREELEYELRHEDKMWFHVCKDAGPTHTAKGEPCNWCNFKEPIQRDWKTIR